MWMKGDEKIIRFNFDIIKVLMGFYKKNLKMF